MASIVIIGAGLTGISTAYHLEQYGITDYKMFEKENEPGGLCRSVMQDGFTFDFTGHLLHVGDAYLRNLIEKLIGFDQFNTIQRRSFIYSQETFTPYPYQINLHGLPPETIVACIKGYLERPSIKEPQTFRDWVLASFGAGFGSHFFFPYQEKIFAYPIDKLTASWTSKFVPSTSLEQILYGALSNQGDTAVGYNAQFFYPKQGGIYAWVKAFAHALKQPIYTGMAVKKIDMKTKEILFENGHTEPYDILVNTMPLDTFLHRLKEPSNSTLHSALNYLKCNQVINFNVGVDHLISEKHWIYYPEEQYPFYRLGFPHNFASSMAPAGCSSLYGEFSHINQSPEWIANTLDRSLKKVKQLFNISDENILTQVIMQIPHAYVIFDQWRDANLPRIHAHLNQHAIYSIGRYGAWKYASMQDAVLDGKEMVETITGKHYETIPHALNHLHESAELPR